MALVTLAALPGEALAKRAHLVSQGGWGTTQRVVVRGRALKGKPSSGAKGGGTLRKVASSVHAFVRNDLEHVEVKVTDTASGQSWIVETDGEGFYDAQVAGPFAAGEHVFEVRLEGGRYESEPVSVTVPIVDADAEGLLVICDIDDTIVETGVTGGKAAMIAGVLSSNAEDVQGYPLAAETLTAFADAGAVVTYVSAGPVELAARLTEMLARNGFPAGPIFLRHYDDDGIGDPTEYKRAHIDRLMSDFSKRRAVFFGDNGEQDPGLFKAVAADTGRVAAAYVRTTLDAKADDARYAGLTLYGHWRDVARHAGKARLLRWMAAARIALTEAP